MTGNAPPLILFDVDGTLLITKGATSRCIRRACREVLGQGFTWTDVTPGLLDPQIFEYLATHNGCLDPHQCHDAYRTCYLKELEDELNQRRGDVTVLPGIRGLLAILHARQQRNEVVLGLLTGNYGEAVMLKLRAAKIDPAQFPIHAFAEDGRERSDLLVTAIRRYAEHVGRPADPKRVIVVGDTPRDIACAHSRGCIAFTVATGWYSREALVEADANHVVEDFSSPQPLLDLLASETARGSPTP